MQKGAHQREACRRVMAAALLNATGSHASSSADLRPVAGHGSVHTASLQPVVQRAACSRESGTDDDDILARVAKLSVALHTMEGRRRAGKGVELL